MDLAELTCDISIADCINEVAEDRLRLHMYVEAFAVPLQALELIDRLLLGHRVLDLGSYVVNLAQLDKQGNKMKFIASPAPSVSESA